MKIEKIFALIAVQILLATNSFSSTPQDSSITSSLEGTRWEHTIHLDSNTLIQIVEYIFHKSGKVEMVVNTVDAVGIPDRIDYHTSGRGRPEEERGRAVVVPGIPAGRILETKSELGTYKRNGNSILMEFSGKKINATIKGNRMEGEIIAGEARKKWLVSKRSELSEASLTSTERVVPTRDFDRQADRKLRAGGIYNTSASELIMVDRLHLTGGPFTVNVSMTIISIDKDGTVTVQVHIGGRTGKLLGRLDPRGELQLTGMLGDSYNATHEATLNALVKEGSLTTAKYILRSGGTRVTGEFQF